MLNSDDNDDEIIAINECKWQAMNLPFLCLVYTCIIHKLLFMTQTGNHKSPKVAHNFWSSSLTSLSIFISLVVQLCMDVKIGLSVSSNILFSCIFDIFFYTCFLFIHPLPISIRSSRVGWQLVSFLFLLSSLFFYYICVYFIQLSFLNFIQMSE